MVWLKDWFIAIRDIVTDIVYQLTIARYVDMLRAIRDKEALDLAYAAIPIPLRKLARVKNVYDGHKMELDLPGEFGPFAGVADALFEGFGKLKDGAEMSIAEIIKTVLPSDSPALVEAFDPAIERLMDTFFTAVEFRGKEVDEATKTEITNKIKPMIKLVVTFEVGSWLAEWIQPMKNTGLRHVAHGLYDTVGFKALSAAYLDPIRLNLITQPTKYSINELTTPFIPSWMDVLNWYGRGHIDEAEMVDLRKKHGIEGGWDARYQRSGTKASSYFMLNAIAKEGFWDVDDFRFWLSDAGFGAFLITGELFSPYEKKYGLKPPSGTQIDFLLDAYKNMNLSATVGNIRAMRMKRLKDGWISREDFEADLAKYKITAADAKDVLDEIEIAQKLKDKKELQRAFEKKFTYGRITAAELKTELTKLKLRDDYIDARLLYLLTVKEGKLAIEEEKIKDLTNAQIISAWESGVKEKGWALKRIDDKGYTTEDAVTIIDIEEQDQIEDEDDEWVRAYEERTKGERMSLGDLEKKYIALGKSVRWAEGRATYIHEVMLGGPLPPVTVKEITQGVKVYSSPSYASIFIDGIDTGKLTSETIDLAAGTYTIRLELADYETWEQTVIVRAEEYIEVRGDLISTVPPPEVITQGVKVYSSPSYASIFIDGVDTGKLTSETIDLAAGSYTIRLELEDYETWIRSVDVPVGIYIEVRKELISTVPPPPEVITQGVKVYSTPSYASIFIDGVDTGKLTSETIDLDVGTYTIRLELAGYETLERTVIVRAEEYIEVRGVLLVIE